MARERDIQAALKEARHMTNQQAAEKLREVAKDLDYGWVDGGEDGDDELKEMEREDAEKLEEIARLVEEGDNDTAAEEAAMCDNQLIDEIPLAVRLYIGIE